MADDREDLIEAIKRRNEERARKLRERIARGEFDKFTTPLESVDEITAAGPETIPAPTSDFDLSAFPPPPEPAAFAMEEPPAATTPAPPPEVVIPPVDIPPPEIGPPDIDLAAFTPPDFGPADLGVTVEAGTVTHEAEVIPPAVEERPPAEAVGIELTALDLEGVTDFLAPQTWEGEPAAAPPAEAVKAETVTAPEKAPALEIEVEAAVPKVPPAEEVAPPERRAPREEFPAAPSRPLLREEEAEAIKLTIEEELREVEPAAPPMPRRPEVAAPVTAAPPRVEPPATAVTAAAAPTPEAPAAKAEADISIVIEVRGNKVRIERRNITLAGAIDLFKAILNRYENK